MSFRLYVCHRVPWMILFGTYVNLSHEWLSLVGMSTCSINDCLHWSWYLVHHVISVWNIHVVLVLRVHGIMRTCPFRSLFFVLWHDDRLSDVWQRVHSCHCPRYMYSMSLPYETFRLYHLWDPMTVCQPVTSDHWSWYYDMMISCRAYDIVSRSWSQL